MPAAEKPQDTSSQSAATTDLGAFADLPAWLLAIVQPERVRAALTRAIAEIAWGELTAKACEISRVRMKKEYWTGIYQLTVEMSHGDAPRVIRMQGTLIPLDQPEPSAPVDGRALGSEGWRCFLPDLRLLLETQPPEAALPALPTLTDPELARGLIEQSMRAAAPEYRELRIQSCMPRVVRYKAGQPLHDSLRSGLPGRSGRWPFLAGSGRNQDLQGQQRQKRLCGHACAVVFATRQRRRSDDRRAAGLPARAKRAGAGADPRRANAERFDPLSAA